MGNMHYCRFRNTLDDLQDCRDDMGEPEDREEKRARIQLIKLCREIADDYGDEIEG